MSDANCIAVLGPTASGKTRLSCRIAYELRGEIISADSRQVYRQLDIGTGKDLDEYTINGKKIPYYGIDIVPAGEQFYLHQFMQVLETAFHEIRSRHNLPVICGGTGLYLDALRKDFSLTRVKENETLRLELQSYSKQQLTERLDAYPGALTQQVDRSSAKRLIRGIEIAEHCQTENVFPGKKELPYRPYYIGITPDTELRKQQISRRLKKRLENGLVEEAEQLMNSGIPPERLELLGLEYKFVLHYLQHKLSKKELEEKLQTAIFQFAKRQMTWFRKMEKEGVNIHWVTPGEDLSPLFKTLQQAFRPEERPSEAGDGPARA